MRLSLGCLDFTVTYFFIFEWKSYTPLWSTEFTLTVALDPSFCLDTIIHLGRPVPVPINYTHMFREHDGLFENFLSIMPNCIFVQTQCIPLARSTRSVALELYIHSTFISSILVAMKSNDN